MSIEVLRALINLSSNGLWRAVHGRTESTYSCPSSSSLRLLVIFVNTKQTSCMYMLIRGRVDSNAHKQHHCKGLACSYRNGRRFEIHLKSAQEQARVFKDKFGIHQIRRQFPTLDLNTTLNNIGETCQGIRVRQI